MPRATDQSARDAARAKFSLGAVYTTSGVQDLVPREEVAVALRRHQAGDWGELDRSDRRENECALREGFRLFSAYRSKDGRRFWVITEADRSVTTILFPEEY